jgi:hypothetical protein
MLKNYVEKYMRCWFIISSWADPGSDLNRFPTKPSTTIIPPGKLEGNVAQRSLTQDKFYGDYNT